MKEPKYKKEAHKYLSKKSKIDLIEMLVIFKFANEYLVNIFLLGIITAKNLNIQEETISEIFNLKKECVKNIRIEKRKYYFDDLMKSAFEHGKKMAVELDVMRSN